MTTKTCTLITPAATRDNASEALCAWFGDDPGSQQFTVGLSATGQAPATHYAMSMPMPEDKAQTMLAMCAGTLPTNGFYGGAYSLSGYDVSGPNAIAAMLALVGVAAVDQQEGVSATDHLNAQTALLELQNIAG